MYCEKHSLEYEPEWVHIFGSSFQSACPLCSQEQEQQEKEEAERKQKESDLQKKLQWYKKLNIEPEYYGATFENYIAKTESQKRALQSMKDLVSGKLKKVILLGGNGIGKTHLGNSAVKETDGLIMTAYEISLYLRGGIAKGEEEKRLDHLCTVPLLFVDEMGRTKLSEAEQNWNSYIFDKRHVRGLRTGIASNYHLARSCKNGGCPRCFENLLDNDSISRFFQNGIVIECMGEDMRRIKKM